MSTFCLTHGDTPGPHFCGLCETMLIESNEKEKAMSTDPHSVLLRLLTACWSKDDYMRADFWDEVHAAIVAAKALK